MPVGIRERWNFTEKNTGMGELRQAHAEQTPGSVSQAGSAQSHQISREASKVLWKSQQNCTTTDSIETV
jgi:hypothetical protein